MCIQKLQDVSQMPKGDMTLVGEKGLTLSGGQKARVSLARYSLRILLVLYQLHLQLNASAQITDWSFYRSYYGWYMYHYPGQL